MVQIILLFKNGKLGPKTLFSVQRLLINVASVELALESEQDEICRGPLVFLENLNVPNDELSGFQGEKLTFPHQSHFLIVVSAVVSVPEEVSIPVDEETEGDDADDGDEG